MRGFKTALITGVAGSGGSFLAEHLVEHRPQTAVHGVSRWHSATDNRNLHKIRDRIKLHECDLLDFSSIVTVLREVQPDVVFHLASHANVRASFATPLAVIQNNIMGTANLFEALRLSGLDPVVMHCSTSEVYGQVDPSHVPIREDCPLRPASPYSVSKITQDLLAQTYFAAYKTKMIRTRMFAYLNPRRADLFATSFALQVARIEAGLQDELRHGNLDSVRTIIDVRDAMAAYELAATKCDIGEVYNIGGTTVIKVGEFLELLKKYAKKPIPSRVDPALLRPADVTLQIPAVDKFIAATGWRPRYSFAQSVEMLLDHCRREVAREATAREATAREALARK